MLWTALIILQVSSPVQIATAPGPMHMDLIPTQPGGSEHAFSMTVGPDKANTDTADIPSGSVPKFDRITGVEADTTINVPAASTLTFPTQAMCDAASATLSKQNGVLSVSCVQTQ